MIDSISAVPTIEPYPSRLPFQLKLKSANGGKETPLLCHTDHIYLLHAPKAAGFLKKNQQIFILRWTTNSHHRSLFTPNGRKVQLFQLFSAY